MTNIKKILIMFSLIILSGCSVEYNLKFDENFRVNDEFILTSKYEEFEENKPDYWQKFWGTRLSEAEFVNPLFEEYSDYIQTTTKRYNDFDTYSEYEYLKKYVKEISLDNDKDYVFRVIFNDKFKEDIYNNESMKELRINIEFPHKVLSSNATSNEENIYTWVINKENKIDQIYIEYRNPKIMKTTNKVSFIFVMIVSILVLSLFIYNIYVKNKKINDLEY